MKEAIFISDIHLHPDAKLINQKFTHFVDWVIGKTHQLYILGDFFHAWAGDDDIEPWSAAVIQQLSKLKEHKVTVNFMHGNRDFLLGSTFAKLTGIHWLSDPCVIKLTHEKVMLTHGDGYCSLDKSHQYFRKLTRNIWFKKLFLRLPLKWRKNLVSSVRNYSQNNSKNPKKLGINTVKLLDDMRSLKINTVVHGHIHTPVLNQYQLNQRPYYQYVLSDWDDKLFVLCYDKAKGFEFIQM